MSVTVKYKCRGRDGRVVALKDVDPESVEMLPDGRVLQYVGGRLWNWMDPDDVVIAHEESA